MRPSGAGNTLQESCIISFLFLLIAVSAFAVGSTEQVLHRFHGGSDGSDPLAAMIADRAGNLYGTTNEGGGSANCVSGCGTAFQLSPPAVAGGAWKETLLHSFQGGSDGANPQTPLVADSAGNLYGTTFQGGKGNCGNIQQSGCGTVFELTPPSGGATSWTYRVLYSFQGVPGGQGIGDGAWPAGLALSKDGSLYGFAYEGGNCTTNETGTSCSGAAFKLENSGGTWSETIVFRFPGPYFPFAGPVFDANGNLYGAGPGGVYGFGAVFRLQPPNNRAGWTQAGVYDFHGTSGDGAFPEFGLVFDAAGNLYGATLGTPQGSYSNVIEVSPTLTGEWAETVLFNFNPITTGYQPGSGPIVAKNGYLYGATTQGGQSDFGTVYELIPPASQGSQWTENVLYSFFVGNDGFAPQGGLAFGKGGALYGTTPSGGDMSCGGGNGCGTIFRVTP